MSVPLLDMQKSAYPDWRTRSIDIVKFANDGFPVVIVNPLAVPLNSELILKTTVEVFELGLMDGEKASIGTVDVSLK